MNSKRALANLLLVPVTLSLFGLACSNKGGSGASTAAAPVAAKAPSQLDQAKALVGSLRDSDGNEVLTEAQVEARAKRIADSGVAIETMRAAYKYFQSLEAPAYKSKLYVTIDALDLAEELAIDRKVSPATHAEVRAFFMGVVTPTGQIASYGLPYFKSFLSDFEAAKETDRFIQLVVNRYREDGGIGAQSFDAVVMHALRGTHGAFRIVQDVRTPKDDAFLFPTRDALDVSLLSNAKAIYSGIRPEMLVQRLADSRSERLAAVEIRDAQARSVEAARNAVKNRSGKIEALKTLVGELEWDHDQIQLPAQYFQELGLERAETGLRKANDVAGPKFQAYLRAQRALEQAPAGANVAQLQAEVARTRAESERASAAVTDARQQLQLAVTALEKAKTATEQRDADIKMVREKQLAPQEQLLEVEVEALQFAMEALEKKEATVEAVAVHDRFLRSTSFRDRTN